MNLIRILILLLVAIPAFGAATNGIAIPSLPSTNRANSLDLLILESRTVGTNSRTTKITVTNFADSLTNFGFSKGSAGTTLTNLGSGALLLTNSGIKSITSDGTVTLTDNGTSIQFSAPTNGGVNASTVTNIVQNFTVPFVTNTTLAIILGDSKSDDQGTPGPLNWTAQLLPLGSFSNKIALENLSVSGTTLQTQLANSTNRLKPVIQANSNRLVSVFIPLGVNDAQGGRTLAQMTNDLVQLSLAARSWGAKQIIVSAYGGTGLVSMTLKTNFQQAVSNLTTAGVFNNWYSEWAADGSLSDSVHPTYIGSMLVASNANLALTTNFPAIVQNSLANTWLGRSRFMSLQPNDTAIEWDGYAIGEQFKLRNGPAFYFEASANGFAMGAPVYMKNQELIFQDSGATNRGTVGLLGGTQLYLSGAGVGLYNGGAEAILLAQGNRVYITNGASEMFVGTNFSMSNLGGGVTTAWYHDAFSQAYWRNNSGTIKGEMYLDRSDEKLNIMGSSGLRLFADSLTVPAATIQRTNVQFGGNVAVTNLLQAKQANLLATRISGALIDGTGGSAVEIEGGASPAIQAYDRNAGVYTNLLIYGKSVAIGNGSPTLAATNGSVRLALPATNASPSIMLSLNPTTLLIESSAIPSGGSGSTNVTTIAAGSITMGSGTVTNGLTVSNIVVSGSATSATVVAYAGFDSNSNLVRTAGGSGGDSSLTNMVTLVSSTNVVSDVSLACNFKLTLTNNIILANPTNSAGLSIDGRTVKWRLKQDSTGSRTVTLGSKFRTPSSLGSPLTFSSTTNATDILAAIYNAADDKWDVTTLITGY